MKSVRVLTLLLALALLCTGCAAGGAAETTPAPDMSDLPLDGGYAYLRVEVLSRDKDVKTLEVKARFRRRRRCERRRAPGGRAGLGRLFRPAVDGDDDRLRRVDHHLRRPRPAGIPAAADVDRKPGSLFRARGEIKEHRRMKPIRRCICHQNFFFLHTHRLMPTVTMLTMTTTG